MKIQIIPCLKDNYSYLIIDEGSNIACVIDPSEAGPIIEYLENTQIKLNYNEWFKIESGYDNARVLVSSDSGQNWKKVSESNGDSQGWRESEIDITPYSDKTISLRFQLSSDESITAEGWYIDNLSIYVDNSVFLS